MITPSPRALDAGLTVARETFVILDSSRKPARGFSASALTQEHVELVELPARLLHISSIDRL